MKQILQNLKNGETELAHIPTPQCRPGHLLIASRRSLISAGTERMLVEFGQANLLAKARAQPDRVRQVLDKVKTDGLLPTMEAVFARLDQPLPLGYCNAGRVLEVGAGVNGFAVGERVISNGPHAEIVNVPQHLCARIPANVTDDEAAFTVLAAIGLQGVRLARPTLGESVVVIGLGLVGLLSVQLLRANGCRVLGLDFNAQRLELARRFGAETADLSAGVDPVTAGLTFSNGRGVDAVLIAATTPSSDPVHQAAQMSRKRGRIVLVGVTGLALNRADFYEKELTFQVSCSYGPGRYDEQYEQQGRDYPFGLVRWTEQRNFEAVLDLMQRGSLDVKPLISHRLPLSQAAAAYDLLQSDRSVLGVLLEYPEQGVDTAPTVTVNGRRTKDERRVATNDQSAIRNPQFAIRNSQSAIPVVGVIGAGNFTSLVLLPALAKTPARLKSIASAGGVSAQHAARKFGFQQATTDYRTILHDPEINTVFITTRHNSHAKLVIEALAARKHVFVEKPLALNWEQLQAVKAAYLAIQTAANPRRLQGRTAPPQSPPPGGKLFSLSLRERAGVRATESTPLQYQAHLTNLSAPDPRHLMVGFNRRFSPLAQKMKTLLAGRTEPVSLIYTVNAGAIPAEHWTQDPAVGGGRIIGEGCHFIDLLRFLVDRPIVGLEAHMLGRAPGAQIRQDKMSIMLAFADGSTGVLHYLANGHKSYPKERVEAFSQGRVLLLDNFKTLHGYGWPGFKKKWLFRQDKGHQAEAAAFIERVTTGGPPLIPWPELEEVTQATFTAVEQAARPLPPL